MVGGGGGGRFKFGDGIVVETTNDVGEGRGAFITEGEEEGR